MGGEPRGDGRNLAVRQQLDDPTPLQVADDRAVAVVAAERPIIDVDHCQGLSTGTSAAPHDAQQGVVSHRQHEPGSEDGTGSSAESKAKMVDDPLHPPGATGSLRHGRTEALGKDPLAAVQPVTAEATRHKMKLDGSTA